MSIAEKARKLGQSLVDAVPASAHILAPLLRLTDRLQGGELHRHVQKDIDVFCTPEQKADAAYLRRLRRDMWYCSVRYLCAFNEYFLFDFPDLSHEGRKTFITELQKNDACASVNPPELQAIFQNKWQTYQRFGRYYGRDAFLADSQVSERAFYRFAESHPHFIAKPVASACGDGVRAYDAAALGREGLAELLTRARTQPMLLEEPIVQSEDMARFHPASVNTVRIATFRQDGTVHILFTYLRTGRGGSVVDNASAGGFAASIDPDTGIVFTPAICKTTLESALVHPDTGVQIIGARIPRWEEALALVRELTAVVPEQRYVGWDLALTDSGWVMVEGNNTSQMSCPQFTTRRGIRPLLAPYFHLRHG